MVEQYSDVSLVLGVLFVPKYDTYAALLLVSFSYLGELSILGHFNETLPRIPYVGTKKYTQVYWYNGRHGVQCERSCER